MKIKMFILILPSVFKVVAEKILMKNVHMCYMGVTEGKIEKGFRIVKSLTVLSSL